ncbi:MAG: hypothetical protein K6T94_17095 [Paenibacillus sp.]|nr:hypothetical protein [Paenibacillus sp.]
MEFNSIYFHDSELKEIRYDWNTFTLVLMLNIFLEGLGKPNYECILKFNDCSHFEVPHKAPWGDSLYVNGANYINNEDTEINQYEIEMISGDIIKIEAMTFEVIKITK